MKKKNKRRKQKMQKKMGDRKQQTKMEMRESQEVKIKMALLRRKKMVMIRVLIRSHVIAWKAT